MAGGPDGTAQTFAILTRPALSSISDIHDRQPVIIAPEYYAAWLEKAVTDPEQIAGLCAPPASGNLLAYPVAAAVGKADIDGPELIAKL